MPAAIKNLTAATNDQLEAGATFSRTWQLMDTETGLAHNLSTYTGFRSSFRQTFADTQPDFQATVTITDAPNGIITFLLDAIDLSTFADAETASTMSGVWDLEGYITDSPNPEVVTRFLMGSWDMTQEVTQTGD